MAGLVGGPLGLKEMRETASFLTRAICIFPAPLLQKERKRLELLGRTNKAAGSWADGERNSWVERARMKRDVKEEMVRHNITSCFAFNPSSAGAGQGEEEEGGGYYVSFWIWI